MINRDVYRALNRLLTVLERSLPTYLCYAMPWTRKQDEKALEAVRRIAEDQQRLARQAADVVLEAGPVNLGEYPIEFLDMHDLSLQFLLKKLAEYQKRDIAVIARTVEELRGDRRAYALAEEALGAARGHLETLEELIAPASSPQSTG